MAAGIINLQKASGGITKISSADGTGVTELVVPESGNLVSVDTAVTDNAIARYDSTTGKLQNSGVVIDDNNRLLVGTPPVGFNTLGQLIVSPPTPETVNLVLTNKTNDSYTYFYNDGNATVLASSYNTTAGYKPIVFQTGGSERMRIDTAGRVGLGTTTPTTTLDVVGNGRFQQQATSGTSGAIIIKEDSGSVNGGVIQWVNPATTLQRAAINVKPDFSWEISNSNSLMFKISTVGDFLATLGTGGLGYGTGAGGTVTQLTSKSTSVTLNKPTGKIIMNNAALAAGAGVSFGVANSLITTSDNIIISHQSVGAGNGTYSVGVDSISNGSFGVYVKNTSGGSLSEAIILNFTIIKGAIS